VLAAPDLAWADITKPDGTPTGLRSTDIWGNSKQRAHGTLTLFPPDLAEPLHRHSHTFNVLVMAGTLRFTIDGRDSPDLGAGSFVTIAPGVPHSAHCLPGPSCEVYVEQDAALDVELVAK
jgi:quercetin dioxygenase-like cupin family protein